MFCGKKKEDSYSDRELKNCNVWQILTDIVEHKSTIIINEVEVKIIKTQLSLSRYKLFLNDEEVLCFNPYNFNELHGLNWGDWVIEADKVDTYSDFILDNLKPLLSNILKESNEKREAEIKQKVDKVGL